MESNRLVKPFVVRATKDGEETKFVITCGKYMASEKTFDEAEQAEAYIEHHLTSAENWVAIGTLVNAILDCRCEIEKLNEQKTNEK